jgi:hypothetical protein
VAGGDDVSIDHSGYLASFANKNVGQAKPVTVVGVVLGGSEAGNYSVSQPSGLAADISKASLDLNAVSDSKVYDGGKSSGGVPTVSGLKGTDTVTGKAQAFQSKNVLGAGNSTLEVTAYTVNDDNLGGNYSVSTHTASGTISRADLHISAVSDSKVYDGTTSSNKTPTVSGLQGSTDSVSGLTQAFASKNVLGAGNSVLQVGIGFTVNDGNLGNNYSATLHDAAGTITKAALDLYAVSDSKVYDGTTSSDETPSVSGLKGSADDVTGRAQAFQSKNVLGVGGSTLQVTAYTIADGNSGGNYSVTPHTAAGTITPKNLTIGGAVANNKTYDGNATATVNWSGAGLVGVVNPDSVGFSTAAYAASFNDKNVGQNKAVSVSGIALSGTEKGNYSLTQPSLAADITVRTLTVTATAVDKVYNGTTDATVTLGTNKVAGDYVNVAYTNASFVDANVGTAKIVNVSGISITGGVDAGNYSLGNATAATTANITVSSSATTVSVTPSSQQYSDIVTLSATVTGGGTPAGTVQFKVDGANVGSPQILSGGSASLSNYQIVQSPTSHSVTAAYMPANVNWGTSTSAGKTLTVSKEDASAEFSGAVYYSSPTAGGSVTATLTAVITDADDGSRGDIRNATVSFVNRDQNGTAFTNCANRPVGLITAGDTTVGTATCTTTLTAGTSLTTANEYTVGLVVNNWYTRDNSTDNTIVTVAQSVAGSITGGGYLVNELSGGQYAGDVGKKTNFGFNVRLDKNNAPKGQINTIVRRGGRVYQIKGNAMTSLTTKVCTSGAASSTCPGTATFNGKANIQDITNPIAPISIDGNASLQVTMTDKGEPGSSDTIGITLWDKNGGMWFSSRWVSPNTLEQLLGGGNTVVR